MFRRGRGKGPTTRVAETFYLLEEPTYHLLISVLATRSSANLDLQLYLHQPKINYIPPLRFTKLTVGCFCYLPVILARRLLPWLALLSSSSFFRPLWWEKHLKFFAEILSNNAYCNSVTGQDLDVKQAREKMAIKKKN